MVFCRQGRWRTQWLAAGVFGGRVSLYDAHTRRPAQPTLEEGPTAPANSLVFDRNAQHLAVAAAGGQVHVWDLGTGRLVPSASEGLNGYAVAFSPRDDTLGAGFTDGLRLRDLAASGDRSEPVPTQGGVAQGIAFSPDGTYVATANRNGTISLVDVVGRRKLGEPMMTTLPVGLYSPDGDIIAAPGADGSVMLLDPDNGREVRRLAAPTAQPLNLSLPMPPGLAFSSDGTQLAYGGMSGKITIFETATGAVLKTLTPPTPTTSRPLFPGAESLVGPLAFSPDGSKLVVASLETGTIFDLRSGRQIGHPAGWTTLATNTFYTPDGALVVVSGFDLETLIFDPDTGDQIGSAITDASIAVNGPTGTLLTTNHSGTIRIIDLATREPIGPPMVGLQVPIGPMVALPGGTEVIASYATGEGVQIFDVATGEPIGDPFPSQAPYAAASVSPDGKTLVGFDDTHLMRWNIDRDTWADTACKAAGRNLTRDEWARYLPNGGPYQTTCPDHPS